MRHLNITREPWKPRWGILGLVGLAFCLPFGIGLLSQIRVRDGLDRWVSLEKNNEPQREELRELFPRRSEVIISWKDSHIDDPRIERMAKVLRSQPDQEGILRGGPNQILEVDSPRSCLADLIKSGISEEEAFTRLRGDLIGNGELRIRLSENGREQPEFVRRLVKEGSLRDLKLKVEILDPFYYGASELEEGADDVSGSSEGEAELSEILVSADYDFRVRWDGMHADPQQIEAFTKWVYSLSLPTVGSSEVGDAPIQDCFPGPGSPAALAVKLSPSGEADPEESLNQIRKAATSAGVPLEDLRLGGLPIIETSFVNSIQGILWDSETETPWYLKSSALLCAVVLLMLTLWFVRDGAWTLILSAMGIISVSMSVVVPAWNDPGIGFLTVFSLILVFSLGLVLAQPWLHLDRLYASKGSEEHSKTARLRSWFPCLLGIVCLLVGGLTLRSYRIPPIKEMGLCLAAGILVLGILVLYGLPIAISKYQREWGTEILSNRRDWVHLAKLLIRRRYSISLGLTALMVAALIGLQNVEVENLFLTLFPENSPVRRDLNFIDKGVCGTIPVESLVVFEKSALEEMDFQKRLQLIRSVSHELRQLGEVTSCRSLANFYPDSAIGEETTGSNEEKTSRRDQLKHLAEVEAFETQVRDQSNFGEWCRTLSGGIDRNSDQSEVWRITARVQSDRSPEHLLGRVNGACQSVIRYYPGVRHQAFTDGMLSLGDLETVKDSAIVSVGAFIGVSIAVLLILLHNPAAAGLALMPIFLGCVVPAGISSWLGVRIGPVYLMSLPFVLGVNAVLTLNLLAAFCFHLQNGRDRMAAAAEAFGDLGPVMCHIYIILGAGLGVLGFAEFGLVRNLGMNTLIFLGTSFILNFAGIPSLCAGWIGLCLEQPRKKLKQQKHSESSDSIDESIMVGTRAPEIAVSHTESTLNPKSSSPNRRRIDGGPKKIA